MIVRTNLLDRDARLSANVWKEGGGGERRLRPIYNLLSAMRHAIGDR